MAKYKPSKNKKKHIVKKLQDTEGYNDGFGSYQESTGGGHPFEAGNSNTRTTRENGQIRHAENPKTDQPRTGDGKFTYKSVNGKSIDPKYGPSRGKTVNPLLTGGENGVKIEDVKQQFNTKTGSYWDKYKDKWFKKGGKIVTEGLSTKISAKDVWDMAKEYDESLGEFKGESQNWETKVGKKSAAELAAQQKAHATKEQQFAIDASTGGIEQKGSLKEKIKQFAKSKSQPAPAEKEPVEEQPAPAQEPVENPEDKKPWGSGKYNIGQRKTALSKIKNEAGDEYDPEIWENDEFLEEFIDANPTILD